MGPPPKKRKNVPTLQDLLDRPICYYCEKDFEDMTYLIDHMKAKHYKCKRCGRRLTTAGGLSVHMSQVHKEKLEKIDNAMQDREKPDIEIFGMEGFPEKLLNAYKTRTTNEYFKHEQQQRKETGNPPKGTAPAAANPQRHETMEEMKARLAEFKAKKAAAKAAAANGGSDSGNNTPPVNPDAPVGSAPQSASAQIMQEPDTTEYDASSKPTNLDVSHVDFSQHPMRGYDIAPYPPMSTAYDQKPMMPSQSMYPASSTPMPSMYPQSYTSMAPYGSYPAAAGAYPPRPPIGMGGSPPPSAFQHGSPPSVVPSGVPRQNSLPSAPGLPQRPAFDSPNISKEDMAKMHIGSGASPTGPPMPYNGLSSSYGSAPPPLGPPPPYGIPNPPNSGYPSNGPPGTQYSMSNSPNGMVAGPWYSPAQGGSQAASNDLSDGIDKLIAEVTNQVPPANLYNQESTLPIGQKHERREPPVPKPSMGISRRKGKLTSRQHQWPGKTTRRKVQAVNEKLLQALQRKRQTALERYDPFAGGAKGPEDFIKLEEEDD